MTALAEYMTLTEQVEVLESKLLSAQIDANLKDSQIRQLKEDLASARRQIAEMNASTQTMQKLRILSDSNDNDGVDPYDTGKFDTSRVWGKVR